MANLIKYLLKQLELFHITFLVWLLLMVPLGL
jgi:hypothetical protein